MALNHNSTLAEKFACISHERQAYWSEAIAVGDVKRPENIPARQVNQKQMKTYKRLAGSIFLCFLYSCSLNSYQDVVFRYSEKKRKLLFVNDSGIPIYSKVLGNQNRYLVEVVNNNVKKNSPSIVLENSTVTFKLKDNNVNKKLLEQGFAEIVLKYDFNSLSVSKPFKKGDMWILMLTDKLKLIDIEYVEPVGCKN